ncbi:MAG: hypothetical protein ACT4PI_14165 [Actinomycetota bacterium]
MRAVDTGEDRLDELTRKALERRPDAQVFVLPRADGQYSNHASDVLGLLDEVGVPADYATDPMATGVFAQKSADVILPPLLIVFSDAAALAGAIEGVTMVIRWFTGKLPHRTVSVEVALQRGVDGSSRHVTKIDGATADEAERLLRQAARMKPPK